MLLFFGGLFIGTFVGVLMVALCQMSAASDTAVSRRMER